MSFRVYRFDFHLSKKQQLSLAWKNNTHKTTSPIHEHTTTRKDQIISFFFWRKYPQIGGQSFRVSFTCEYYVNSMYQVYNHKLDGILICRHTFPLMLECFVFLFRCSSSIQRSLAYTHNVLSSIQHIYLIIYIYLYASICV